MDSHFPFFLHGFSPPNRPKNPSFTSPCLSKGTKSEASGSKDPDPWASFFFCPRAVGAGKRICAQILALWVICLPFERLGYAEKPDPRKNRWLFSVLLGCCWKGEHGTEPESLISVHCGRGQTSHPDTSREKRCPCACNLEISTWVLCWSC